MTSPREHGHPATTGHFSPARTVGRGENDGRIDRGLWFCQTDSADGQGDGDEGDVGLMACTPGGEEVRTARTVAGSEPAGLWSRKARREGVRTRRSTLGR